MKDHAILSPSSASRWLACTPSARLESQFPDKSSDAAEEGTAAHALAELEIKCAIGLISDYPKEVDAIYTKYGDIITPEMLQHCEDYKNFVMEQFAEAKHRTPDAFIAVEQRIDLTKYVPESFGTGDICIVADHLLHIVDFKYGKGVKVTAQDNKQLKAYALGALEAMSVLYEVDQVKMSIFQPRIGNVDTFEMAAADLIEWGETYLRPRAQMAFDGEGDFEVGEHCRFCKAKGACKALADYNLELVQYDFKQPALLSINETADILDRSDFFTKWLHAVEDYALDQAVTHGVKYPGYKLVEGRSNRVFTDENEVAGRFMKAGFAEDLIYKPKKLQGITELTKLAKPKKFDELTEGLIIKPEGRPTLVHESDKRPELHTAGSATEDFSDPV